MKQFLLILFVSLSFALTAQTNHKVYFEYGKSKVSSAELERLFQFLSTVPLMDIDSIQVIGYADSVGKVKNNIKLSEKRAFAVSQLIARKINQSIPIHNYAKGEKAKKIEAEDRRVEVHVFHVTQQESVSFDSIVKEAIKHCYLIDYYLLQCCNVSEVKIRNRDFVKLTISDEDLRSRKKIKHYSVSYDTSGNKVLKKLRWIPKVTGEDWWEIQRYEALIPYEDFEQNKVVVFSGVYPCDSCFKDPVINAMYYTDSCLAQDIFLNRNLQFKFIFLNQKTVKVRVPELYVNKQTRYYKGFNKGAPISWETKKRKKQYLYTRLPIYISIANRGYYILPIARKMKCCYLKNTGQGFLCGGCFGYPTKLYHDLELGNNRVNGVNTPYIGWRISLKDDTYQLRFLLAIDSSSRVLSAVKYDYNLYRLPGWFFNPIHFWQRPGAFIALSEMDVMLGSELRYSILPKNVESLEQNIHLGLRYERAYYSAFLQGGVAYNFSNAFEKRVYPILQFGLNFNLTNFFDL